MVEKSEEAKRFDNDKLRLDLIPPSTIEAIGKILTFGAKKYGDNNWKLGMDWSRCIASLKRHLHAFEKGIDFDEESGQLHMSHVLTNAAFLVEYYKIFPQGDDRNHHYLTSKRIGLDIDDVLADWVGHWSRHHNQSIPESWSFDRDIKDKFEALKNNKAFWMSIPIKTSPLDIPFEPVAYITARPIPKEWTEEWLDINKFPVAPVYVVDIHGSKVEAAKECKLDLFVDDAFHNFAELNAAGICCFLFDTLHNQRYNAGFKRIKNLKELI